MNGEGVELEARIDLVNNAGSFLHPGGFCGDIGFGDRDNGAFESAADRFAACGAAMAFRRETWERLGGFAEEFFAYYEDIDWSWRAQLAGMRVRYEPSLTVRHVHGTRGAPATAASSSSSRVTGSCASSGTRPPGWPSGCSPICLPCPRGAGGRLRSGCRRRSPSAPDVARGGAIAGGGLGQVGRGERPAVKVAVYQRHLATLGGGERHALEIARFFRDRGDQVDVLAPPGTPLEVAAERLGLDVGDLRLVTVDPRRPCQDASERSADYDCFVNVSYGSTAVNRSPRGIYACHFPWRHDRDELTIAEAPERGRPGRTRPG